MAEQSMNEPTVVEDDFDLDEWLSTGTQARRSVEIYNRPDLAAEFDALERRLAKAEADEPRDAPSEQGLGEASEAATIRAEMEALHEQWEASKATWVVRALTEDEVKAVHEEYPDPDIPPILLAEEKPEPGSVEAEAREAVGKAFVEARAKVVEARNVAMIALAVVEVRTSRGTAKRVTAAQVEKLRTGPHGKRQTTRLIEAVTAATTGEVDIPRPTSPGRSVSGRD